MAAPLAAAWRWAGAGGASGCNCCVGCCSASGRSPQLTCFTPCAALACVASEPLGSASAAAAGAPSPSSGPRGVPYSLPPCMPSPPPPMPGCDCDRRGLPARPGPAQLPALPSGAMGPGRAASGAAAKVTLLLVMMKAQPSEGACSPPCNELTSPLALIPWSRVSESWSTGEGVPTLVLCRWMPL